MRRSACISPRRISLYRLDQFPPPIRTYAASHPIGPVVLPFDCFLGYVTLLRLVGCTIFFPDPVRVGKQSDHEHRTTGWESPRGNAHSMPLLHLHHSVTLSRFLSASNWGLVNTTTYVTFSLVSSSKLPIRWHPSAGAEKSPKG